MPASTSPITDKVKEFFTAYPKQSFSKGQVIVQAGDDLPGVFYLTEGRISQYDIDSNGNEVVVNVFKPGAFFPMSWAMNHTPNNYFFEASTDAVAHIIPPAKAVAFLQDNPDVTFDLLSRVYRGMDGVLRRMAHLMGGSAKSRLVFELLNAANRFGEPHDDGIFVPLKEHDIAKHSGLARETVNRLLKEFKDAGIVFVVRGGIVISDTRQLEATLGSNL